MYLCIYIYICMYVYIVKYVYTYMYMHMFTHADRHTEDFLEEPGVRKYDSASEPLSGLSCVFIYAHMLCVHACVRLLTSQALR